MSRHFILILFVLSFFFVAGSEAKIVKGYLKKNGAVVYPHFKTRPNKTQRDNYNTKGNINPYTGKKGTKAPLR